MGDARHTPLAELVSRISGLMEVRILLENSLIEVQIGDEIRLVDGIMVVPKQTPDGEIIHALRIIGRES